MCTYLSGNVGLRSSVAEKAKTLIIAHEVWPESLKLNRTALRNVNLKKNALLCQKSYLIAMMLKS